MREHIGRILRWFTHEHKWKTIRRKITLTERPCDRKNQNWMQELWLSITFYKRCEECGETGESTVDSGFLQKVEQQKYDDWFLK